MGKEKSRATRELFWKVAKYIRDNSECRQSYNACSPDGKSYEEAGINLEGFSRFLRGRFLIDNPKLFKITNQQAWTIRKYAEDYPELERLTGLVAVFNDASRCDLDRDIDLQ